MNTKSITKFSSFSLILLAYALIIILWGAWVRISGSGDGCGQHWPLCQGQLLINERLTQQAKTLIEYIHRLKSGLFGILVIFLYYWSRRIFPAGHYGRFTALMALFFTVIEGLLGAKLVLFGLVGQDDSLHRALTMSLHLINTFILLYFLTACWQVRYFAYSDRVPKARHAIKFVMASLMLIAATGAWAALSSTLFQSHSLLEGLQADFSADSHWLLKLRIVHPLAAIALAILCLGILEQLKKRINEGISAVKYLQLLIALNAGFGMIVITSGGVTLLKLSHLLLADLVWIAAVIARFKAK